MQAALNDASRQKVHELIAVVGELGNSELLQELIDKATEVRDSKIKEVPIPRSNLLPFRGKK